VDRKLRILVLEDVQTDFELMEIQLEKENISFISKRVETKADFKKELKDFMPDIILSDYSLPQFDGLSALKLAKEQMPDIPFIIVTGSLSEEVAVTTMKAGAWDYVMKDKLIRLGPAVVEALKLKDEIEKRQQAEELLRENEDQYRTVFANTGTATCILENDGTIFLANEKFSQIAGYTIDEIQGKKTWMEFVVKEDLERMRKQHGLRRKDRDKALTNYEFRFIDRDRNIKNIFLTIDIIPGTKKSVASLLDITERKQAENRIVHLNSLLKTIRNVNQLVVVEKDIDRLLQKVCDVMIETRGYNTAWIGFSGDGKSFSAVKGSGFKTEVYRFIKQVISGNHPHCIKNALAQKEKFLVIDKSRMCGDCFFKDACISKEAAIIRIEHDGRLLGLLAILLAPGISIDDEEIILLQEVTGDIAFAIHDMEVEERRKQVEETLRFTQFAIDQYSDAAFWMGQDAHFIYVNDAACNALGYSREELLTMTVHDIDPDFPEEAWADHWTDIKNRGSFLIESHHRSKDGKVFPIELKVNYLEFGGNEYNCAFARDITERKQAEEALQDRERTYRTLINNLPGFAYRCLNDKNWTMNYISGGCEDITGYSPEDFINNKNIAFNDIIDTDYQQKLWDIWQSVLKEKSTFEYEYPIITKSRQIRWVWERGCGIYSDDGDLLFLEGFITDITERKRAEKALKKSELGFRTVWKNSASGMRVTDENGIVFMVNDAFCKIFGKTKEELEGKPLSVIYSTEKKERIQLKHQERFKSRTIENYFEKELELWNGKRIWIQVANSFIEIEGEKSLLLGIFTDITERKQAEKVLRIERDNLKNIFKAMEDGIYIVNQQYDIQYVNPVLIKDFGIYEGRKCYEYFHDRKEVCPWCKNSDVFAGKTVRWEWYSFKNHRTYDLIDTPLKNPDGSISKLEIFRDITERKRAEKSLKKSEEQLKAIVSNVPVVMWALDKDGIFTLSEGKGLKVLGLKPGEIVGQSIFDVYHETPQILENNRRALAGELLSTIVDMGNLVYESHYSPIHDDKGKVVGMTGLSLDITEHKRAEKALRENEDKYHSLIESSTDPIYLINRDLEYIYANKELLSRLGKPESQVFGHDYSEFHTPEGLKMFSGRIEGVFKSKEPVSFEYRSARDGRYFLRTLNPVMNPETRVVTAVTVISKDITDLKQTEEKLYLANKRLHHLLYSSTTVIYSCKTSGDYGITYASENVLIITGYLSFNFINDPKFWIDHIHPEDRECVLEKMSTISKTENLKIEYRFQKKEGEYIWLHDTKKLIIDEHGTPVEIVGSLLNVTERKQAVKALEESEKNFRTLVENSFDGIMINDIRGNYLYSNKSAAEISGYSVDDLLKLNVKDLTPSKDVEKVMERVWNRIENRTSPSYFEGVCVQKGGKEIQLEITAAQTTWKDIPAEIISMRDVTKRKQLEQQLLQSQKMETVGNLAGGIAHDFNNLLTIIQGQAQIMQMKLAEDDPNYRRIRHIMNASTRAANLTRQLLLFSRKQAMEFLPINLNDTITNLLKMLQRLIGEDIPIQTDLQSDLWTVNADESNIEQVVMNICINARDAMLDGGRLALTTDNIQLNKKDCIIIPKSSAGHFVRLIIEDTGTGIPQDIFDKIFEPFFSTKEVGKGTGLGLSVVYGIVKKHNGWINVYSEPGKGTIFKIYLPVTSKAVEKKTEMTIKDVAIHGNGERILLIEDEEDVRRFIASALRQYGFIIYEASNASEGRSVFISENGKFDLIFSDVILPDKNGFDLIEELLSGKKDIPVIMCSGYTEEKIQQSIISKKGFQFIQKPFKILELLNIISSAID